MTDTDPNSDGADHVQEMKDRLHEVETDIARAREDEEALHPERSEQHFDDSGTVDPGMDDQTIAPG